MRALFFVCPGLIELSGNHRRAAIAANIFRGRIVPGNLPAGLDLMEWRAVSRLAEAGHAIGSHTMSHRCLAGLSDGERAEEIGAAARLLQDRLGGSVPWFAYTFGDAGSIDAPALAEIGRHHHWCRSGVRGANHAGTPPLTLRADNMDLTMSAAWRRLILAGGLDPFYRNARRRLDAMVRI